MTAAHLPQDPGRRRFLRAGAGLGLAAAAPAAFAGPSTSWNFEEWFPAPENTTWRLLDGHDSGHVMPGWRRKSCDVDDRISFERAPDSRAGFCHVVHKRDIVDPVGIDSARVPADFSTFSRVLLRYHHWIEQHSYIDGKWVGLQLGRGWVGRGHVREADELYGSDGASATTMHPGRSGGNGIRLLATHSRQKSPYGENVGDGREVLDKGRWLTVDVVVDKHEGHRLYVDGRMMAESYRQTPVRNWNACGVIWYRTRLMHGGTPSQLPALHDYREWLGGYFIGVA